MTLNQTTELKLYGFQNRLYEIKHGDVFVLNEQAVKSLLHLPIKKLPLGKKMEPSIICTEKVKRKHWWQFWKPKYTTAKFMYI